MKLESYTVKLNTGHIECRSEKPDGGYHRHVIDPADDDAAKKAGVTDVTNLVWTDDLRKRVAAEKKEAKAKEARELKAAKVAREKVDKEQKAAFEKTVKDAVAAL
jgi:hypothetical protein